MAADFKDATSQELTVVSTAATEAASDRVTLLSLVNVVDRLVANFEDVL